MTDYRPDSVLVTVSLSFSKDADAMTPVQTACQGQTTCVMKVSDTDLNLSPTCDDGVCKYLEVNYTCESRSSFRLNCANLFSNFCVPLWFWLRKRMLNGIRVPDQNLIISHKYFLCYFCLANLCIPLGLSSQHADT